MIPYLWDRLIEAWRYVQANYHPFWDTLDILVVSLAVYWVLLLIKGTRAVQILIGLLLLIGARVMADWAQLATVGLILENFLSSSAVLIIIIILFQNDIRRALARMGRGVFPGGSARQETQMVEEVVRAAQTLAQKRVGALIVLARETSLDDVVEAGTPLDAGVTKELLVSVFLPYSPLHDGAAIVQDGRLAHAGCVLPLTLRSDFPEGLGTRHRAALGVTEETDAVVVVVSEETASTTLVVGGEMSRDLDPPRLRVVLRELLTSGAQDLGSIPERGAAGDETAPAAETGEPAAARRAG